MAQQTLSPISDATISILENQIQTFSALTSYFIEATEKFNDLNMAVVKASVEESGETARHLFSLNDQAELFDFISEQPKLMSEKMHFYNQHVAQISSDVKSNVDKVIEEQMTQAKDNVTTFVAELTKNTPPGSEDMLMAWQAAVSQTSAGFEQMQEAAKQASEVFGATMANMTEQFLQSVQDNSLKTGKRKN